MKMLAIIAVSNLTSIACACGAIYLLVHGNQHGWGWLLFIALFTHADVKFNCGNDDDEKGAE